MSQRDAPPRVASWPKRLARAVTTLYVVAMAAAVTYPGVVPFNTIRPFVLGLPFSFFWVAAWTAGACIVFYVYHWAESR